MKNSRKKDLKNIRQMLLDLNAEVIEKMGDIRSALEDLQSELEDQFDNLSERSQENEVGERVQDDIDDVEYIVSDAADIADLDLDDTESSVFSELFESIDNLLNKEY